MWIETLAAIPQLDLPHISRNVSFASFHSKFYLLRPCGRTVIVPTLDRVESDGDLKTLSSEMEGSNFEVGPPLFDRRALQAIGPTHFTCSAGSVLASPTTQPNLFMPKSDVFRFIQFTMRIFH